jgi:hypothetical protein
LQEVVGLREPVETIALEKKTDGIELDLVTHDAAKFFRMLLKKNGYVLEQLYSPLVLHTTTEHEELKEITRGCITRHHVHHYLGFARTQWDLLRKTEPPRVKPLLYTYRVLLTGIHLMQSGVIEANLPRLNEAYKLPYIDDLIAAKTGGDERGVLLDADLAFHETEFNRLYELLEEAGKTTHLPDQPIAESALNDLLVRVRLR